MNLNLTSMFRIICGELVMSVSLMFTVRLEVSSETIFSCSSVPNASVGMSRASGIDLIG